MVHEADFWDTAHFLGGSLEDPALPAAPQGVPTPQRGHLEDPVTGASALRPSGPAGKSGPPEAQAELTFCLLHPTRPGSQPSPSDGPCVPVATCRYLSQGAVNLEAKGSVCFSGRSSGALRSACEGQGGSGGAQSDLRHRHHRACDGAVARLCFLSPTPGCDILVLPSESHLDALACASD